jgi:predicted small metal-binding protein
VKQFRCGDVVPGCDTVFVAESEREILDHVSVHARDEHGMDSVPPEVRDTIVSLISEREG